MRLIATCPPGLEPILAGELSALGFSAVEPTRSAVRFAGGWPEVWRANYWLRTANRILIELGSYRAATGEELYAGVGEVLRRAAARSALDGMALSDLLTPARTFAVSATSSGSQELRDTRWIALKVKDAIADAQRERFQRRSDVDPRHPDVPLRVWVHNDEATLLLDSSREPLDRRGYRRVTGAAPLREHLAAALVLASGWDRSGPVVDPMCGTGTLLIEAAWIALGRAPGALRESWVFENWPGFEARVFDRIRSDGSTRANGSGAQRAGLRLLGRDLSRDAVRAAHQNLEAAGVADLATIEIADGFAIEPPATPGLIVTNPAHGDRLATTDDEWSRLGDLLKQRFTGWSCALIAGEPSFGKFLGLKPKRRIPVKNGPLDAKILVFDLYRGKRDAGADTLPFSAPC